MTESEYVAEVRPILDQHVDHARSQLAKLSSLLPETTKTVEITIFVDQDGEGFLTVMVALTGPDLHVINKAIRDAAYLFETKMVDGELVPPLPLMDPDPYEEEEFSVHHVLTDCAADWLKDVWEGMDHSRFRIPVRIVGHEDCGMKTPILLQS